MFQLSDQELKEEKKWLEEHNKECRFADSMNQGAIGGRLSYIFTPTSLGVLTKVRCACGEEIDVTDVSNW